MKGKNLVYGCIAIMVCVLGFFSYYTGTHMYETPLQEKAGHVAILASFAIILLLLCIAQVGSAIHLMIVVGFICLISVTGILAQTADNFDEREFHYISLPQCFLECENSEFTIFPCTVDYEVYHDMIQIKPCNEDIQITYIWGDCTETSVSHQCHSNDMYFEMGDKIVFTEIFTSLSKN